MMVQCVTYFGLIQRTPLVGVFRLVELDFYLDPMLFENSTMQIILISYVEPISWLWKDINGISMKQFLQFGQRLITVTGKCIGFKEVPKSFFGPKMASELATLRLKA